jgi:hypothetical protein
MNEHDIRNVLELAKHNQLQYLQWKVEYLKNEMSVLELLKTKSTNDILKLNMAIKQLQSSLPQKGGEMAYMNKESGWYNNTNNLYPIPHSWYNNTGNLSYPIPKPLYQFIFFSTIL